MSGQHLNLIWYYLQQPPTDAQNNNPLHKVFAAISRPFNWNQVNVLFSHARGRDINLAQENIEQLNPLEILIRRDLDIQCKFDLIVTISRFGFDAACFKPVLKKAIAQHNYFLAGVILKIFAEKLLSIEELEACLEEVILFPNQDSALLICMAIQHLEQYAEWDNFDLNINGCSLWHHLNQEYLLIVMLALPPHYLDALLANICPKQRIKILTQLFHVAFFDYRAYDFWDEYTLSFKPRQQESIQFFVTNNLTMRTCIEFCYNFIKYLLENPAEFEKITDILTTIQPAQTHTASMLFMDLAQNRPFVKLWTRNLSPKTCNCLLRLYSLAKQQLATDRYDISLEKAFAIFEVALPHSISHITKKLAQGGETDVSDMQKLLDTLYKGFWLLGFEKMAFISAVNQIQKCQENPLYLARTSALDLDRYSFSISMLLLRPRPAIFFRQAVKSLTDLAGLNDDPPDDTASQVSTPASVSTRPIPGNSP